MRELAAAVVASVLVGSGAAAPLPSADAAFINVHFKLTDLQYRPIAGAPVRLVLGAPKNWQQPDAGDRFVTDADGEHHFRTAALVDRKSKRVSMDFVSTRQLTADHLAVAAELEYMTFRWLYAIDVYQFRDGTNALLDPMTIFTPDGRGRFTKKAQHIGGSWKMAELGGRLLTSAGYEPWDFVFRPDSTSTPDAPVWTLQLAFKKSPEPIRR